MSYKPGSWYKCWMIKSSLIVLKETDGKQIEQGGKRSNVYKVGATDDQAGVPQKTDALSLIRGSRG